MKSPVHRDESVDLAEHIGVAWDDLTGSVLDCNEVQKARFKEIGYVDDKAVCTKIPRAGVQAKRLKVLQTRWIDINKGDGEKSTFRSRVVAMEFNTCGRGEGVRGVLTLFGRERRRFAMTFV